MPLDAKTLLELKGKLLNKKVQIEEELGRIAKPGTSPGVYTTNFTEIGPDEDENASEVEEYTDNLALEVNLKKQLEDVLSAIDRIQNNTYGKCAGCDLDVPLKRLQAYPEAKTCLEC